MTQTIKERPILFSAPMVRAILEDRKTQTRRIFKEPKSRMLPKDEPDAIHEDGGGNWIAWYGPFRAGLAEFTKRAYPNGEGFPCPYGKPGDRLWVRETWHLWGPPGRQFVDWAATCDEAADLKWKPSIHMPRAYSRISLEITGVRVERLQDIRDSDIRAEGVATNCNYMGRCNSSRCPEHARGFHIGTQADFEHLWRKINGPDSWAANPWVWVIEFKRI